MEPERDSVLAGALLVEHDAGPDVHADGDRRAARIGAVMTITTLATIRSKVRLAARRQLNWATGSTHMTGYGPSGRTEIRLAAMSRMDE